MPDKVAQILSSCRRKEALEYKPLIFDMATRATGERLLHFLKKNTHIEFIEECGEQVRELSSIKDPAASISLSVDDMHTDHHLQEGIFV